MGRIKNMPNLTNTLKGLRHIVTLFGFLFILFFITKGDAYAQFSQLTPTPTSTYTLPYTYTPATPSALYLYKESNTARTVVGNPPATRGPRQEALIWAGRITAVLKKGLWDYYNRQDTSMGNGTYPVTKSQGIFIPPPPTGGTYDLYWCTYLIIDAYNLAGDVNFLNIGAHAGVLNMANRWKSFPGYDFLDYTADKNILKSVQPGDVLFHISPTSDRQNDHVSMIKDIVINGAGDGKIVTLNSNASVIEITYTVKAWTIQPMGTMPPIVGFGSVQEYTSTPGGNTPVFTSPSSGSGNSLIKAGRDIKAAYDICENGYTYNVNNVGACLRTQLSGMGYSSSLVDAFESRRAGTITDRNCTECLGYVALALTLVSGSTNTLTQAQASDVLSSSTITAGSITLTKQPAGTSPQPGDIAVAGGGAGHIAIVNSVAGAVFTALESNSDLDCKIRDNRSIPVDRYTFYR